jgi:tetratricopeptide (TPR) repeat protein
VIERLLQAETALDKGLLDVAGRLYLQVVQADPRNAIALVGLARIALREDRLDEARDLAEQALAIDPDEAAAQRLLREAYGEVAAAAPLPEVERPVEAAAAFAAAQRRLLETQAPASDVPRAANVPPVRRPSRRPSLLDRLRRWLLGRRGG